MLLNTFSIVSNASIYNPTPVEDYYYTVTNGEATIIRYKQNEKKVTIPSKLGGYPVTGIGSFAFEFNTALESISLPNSITHIDEGAFTGCINLKSIKIPDSVNSVGRSAFDGCTSLTSISFSKNMESIDSEVFSCCYSLKSITIPSHIKYIKQNAFYDCKSLENVTLSQGIKSIFSNAFQNCTALKSIVIPDSVEVIDPYAFSECTSLERVTIGKGVKTIDNYAFSDCTSLKTVELCEGLETIGFYAFSGCNNLTSINIPYSLIKICSNAFENCTSLINVNIFCGEKLIDYAFVNTNCKITDIYLPDGKIVLNGKNNNGRIAVHTPDIITFLNYDLSEYLDIFNPYNQIDYPKYDLFINDSLVEELVIPDGVKEVKDFAFMRCQSIKSVKVPNSTEIIGRQAFYECNNLKNIDFGNNIKYIGSECIDSTDYYNTNYYNTNNNGTLYIDNYLIKSDFQEIKPDTKAIAIDAFGGDITDCSNINNLNYIPRVASYDFIYNEDYWESGALYIGNNLYKINDNVSKDLIIKDGTKTISDSLLYDTDVVSTVYVPDSVCFIGNNALANCENIIVSENNPYYSSVDGVLFNKDKTELICYPNKKENTYYQIPNGTKSIKSEAFLLSNNLENVIIPDSVTEIEKSSFACMEQLKNITLSNNLSIIGHGAFENCISLKDITIPNNVISIGEDAFRYCINMESVNLSCNASIGKHAFYDCYSLETVNIPEGVGIIKDYAFENCSSLKEVTIPQSVKYIGLYPFTDCSSLTKVTVYYNPYTDYGIIRSIITDVIIPDGVRTISAGSSILSCSSIKSMSISKSVVNIPEIRTVIPIPEKCKITYNEDCNDYHWLPYTFNEVDFSEDTTKLGSFVRIKTETVVIPGHIKSINGFGGTIDKLVIEDGVEYIGGIGGTFKEIIIPDSVTRINQKAFSNCNVSKITIPGSVTEIEPDLFINNKSIREVELQQGITQIDVGAFLECSSLEKVILPEGLKSIYIEAFLICPKLESIYIPRSVDYISPHAFATGYLYDANGNFISGPTLKCIYGYKGTYAEQFANNYGIKFVPLDDPYGTFPDVKVGTWYYDVVEYVANKGFITGYSYGCFGPDDNLKRQDFVCILARIAGADLSKYENKTSKLKDVQKGAYYAAAVNWAVEEGIISGYQNGKFGVNDPITREQVATILYNYMKKPAVNNPDKILSKFPDAKKVSSFARTPMAWAVDKGIISGMGDGTISSTKGATRAQIAAIIERMDNKGMF